MKRHQEVRLTSRELGKREILEQVLTFARSTDDWESSPKGIHDASAGVGESCSIICLHSPATALFFVAGDGKRKGVVLTNIIPRDTDYLPLEEYNPVARRFAADFRRHCRNRIQIRVFITPEDRGLEAAISGKKCQKYFEDYCRPTTVLTHHPSDIDRLNIFICAAHRFGGRCDPDAIAMYLQEDLQWPKPDAKMVRDRIHMGLDLLQAHRRF
jgi:hypothetical protein